jgi:hypothetical protein
MEIKLIIKKFCKMLLISKLGSLPCQSDYIALARDHILVVDSKNQLIPLQTKYIAFQSSQLEDPFQPID